MKDLYSNDVETAAALARQADNCADDDRPSPSEYQDDYAWPTMPANVPVTLEDFAPRVPVGTDDDLPF